MAPADSIAGQYTIPVAIKEKLNDETGEVETEVGGIKARSGFARAKTGAKAEKLAEDVQANLTTDPGVYSAMQNIEGKEFSPPDVFGAIQSRRHQERFLTRPQMHWATGSPGTCSPTRAPRRSLRALRWWRCRSSGRTRLSRRAR